MGVPIRECAAAKSYHRLKRRLFFAGFAAHLLLLLIFQFSGASMRFSRRVSGVTGGAEWADAVVYLSCFFSLFYFVLLPLDFYSGFVVERKFSLSSQTLAHWVGEEGKKYALLLLFFVSTGSGFLFLLKVFPDSWWVYAAIAWLCLSLFVAKIFPRLILPLFYPLHPLSAGPLKESLVELCARARLPVKEIYELVISGKTNKANAALVGIGGSRRILLTDTLFSRYTPLEIQMVVAHELGHHAHRHIFRGIGFNLCLVFLGFYLLRGFSVFLPRFLGTESLADLTGFPALVFLSLVGGMIILPIQNIFSRRQEREADRYALEKLPNKEVFVSLMKKLADQNLSDPDPDPWVEFFLYDHPSISKRIRTAESR